MTNEALWKDIPDYEGLYQAHPDGLIRSLPRHSTRGKILRAAPLQNGYMTVSLSKRSRVTKFYVHRLAWMAVHGPIPDGLIVMHLDDDPSNNALSNLRLGTHKDNAQDMHSKGRDRNGNEKKDCCPQGHPYAGENLYTTKEGWRQCKMCSRARNRKYQKKVHPVAS